MLGSGFQMDPVGRMRSMLYYVGLTWGIHLESYSLTWWGACGACFITFLTRGIYRLSLVVCRW